MGKQTYRERWISEVFRTLLVTDTVRVTLLALALDMDEDGMVAVARDDLAEMLARSDKRVGERIRCAIAAGFIERVSRGQRNGRGRYRATLPGDPSSGRPTVPKKPGVFRTPDRPEEDSLQDGLRGEETSGLQDAPPSRREPFDRSVFRTPHRPEEAAPYRGTARAHSKHGDLDQKTPAPSGTDAPAPHDTETRVSQSARKREGIRWLGERYRLTEFEAASVIAEVTARAPKEIRALVPYLAAMKEGDLADIVGAIQTRTDDPVTGPAEEAPPQTATPEWCGGCDERTRQIELLDGRVARCPNCHPKNHQETA